VEESARGEADEKGRTALKKLKSDNTAATRQREAKGKEEETEREHTKRTENKGARRSETKTC